MRPRENDKRKPTHTISPPVPFEDRVTSLANHRLCLAIVKAVGAGEMTLAEADAKLAEIIGNHVVPQV